MATERQPNSRSRCVSPLAPGRLIQMFDTRDFGPALMCGSLLRQRRDIPWSAVHHFAAILDCGYSDTEKRQPNPDSGTE